MIFCDLEKISKDRQIPNKYMLTMIVATRARQLSEHKGRVMDGNEKFITKAVRDISEGRITFNFRYVEPTVSQKTPHELETGV